MAVPFCSAGPDCVARHRLAITITGSKALGAARLRRRLLAETRQHAPVQPGADASLRAPARGLSLGNARATRSSAPACRRCTRTFRPRGARRPRRVIPLAAFGGDRRGSMKSARGPGVEPGCGSRCASKPRSASGRGHATADDRRRDTRFRSDGSSGSPDPAQPEHQAVYGARLMREARYGRPHCGGWR
jgi:hypothetical protein